MAEEMAAIWEDIDRSESYLVCFMYEEAASLSAAVLRRVGCEGGKWVVGDVEVGVIMESAGLVLVQSLKEMGRRLIAWDRFMPACSPVDCSVESGRKLRILPVIIGTFKEANTLCPNHRAIPLGTYLWSPCSISEISKMLKGQFSPVAAIPTEVLLTRVCLQISDGLSGLKKLLESFLGSWSYVDEKYHARLTNERNTDLSLSCDAHFLLEVEDYLKVVEVYSMTFLGKTLGDVDLSISWVEKAAMPEEKKQDLLGRLQSLYSLKTTASLPGFSSHMLDENESPYLMQDKSFEGFAKSTESSHTRKALENQKLEVLKLYERVEPCFWLFRSVNLKFGNIRVCLSNGKILLGCLFLLVCMVLRRNWLNFNSNVKNQALTLKNALVDFWRLAFSYQVNPLAAIQPLPSVTSARR